MNSDAIRKLFVVSIFLILTVAFISLLGGTAQSHSQPQNVCQTSPVADDDLYASFIIERVAPAVPNNYVTWTYVAISKDGDLWMDSYRDVFEHHSEPKITTMTPTTYTATTEMAEVDVTVTFNQTSDSYRMEVNGEATSGEILTYCTGTP